MLPEQIWANSVQLQKQDAPSNWLLVTERLYLQQQDSAQQQSGLINELKQPLTAQQDPPPTLKALLNSLMYSHDTVCLRSKTTSCLHGLFWQTSSVACFVAYRTSFIA